MPTPGNTAYIADDTRLWIESYRSSGSGASGLIKPALVFRSATDANYINGQTIIIPCYGAVQAANSICNVISPGQRIPGVLSWQVTESLDNVMQTATVTCLDALPISKISTTVTGYGIGTKGGSIASISSMPAQWHSTTIRYQWVTNGLGAADMLSGNLPISHFTDPTLAQNDRGFPRTYQEDNLLYRQFEPEVIKVADLSKFPDPSTPWNESDVVCGPNFQYQGQTIQEWWDIDMSNASGIGAYYILVDGEVMRVTRIDRNNNYIFVIPGGRGVAGTIASHSTGATVQLLGFGPFTSQWAGLGYLMPQDYKVTQSPFRPGNCFVSYEGYGSPGQYSNPNGTGPFSAHSKSSTDGPFRQKQFDRNNNMCFTGYWFTQSPQASLDNTGVPQVTITLNSSPHVLSEETIDPNNVQRSTNTFYSWSKATFDQIGYSRKLPGDWYDVNMWDPSYPGAYPLTISTEFAQHKAFFDHMNDTNNGTTCEFCQNEWLEYVKTHEGGHPSGSILEARAVGKHIYHESIRVFNFGGQFNAGPIKTFGRLMNALALAAWDNPQQGDTLGTRWTKIPNQLFENLTCFSNGRVWSGQLIYDVQNGDPQYDWSNDLTDDKVLIGNRGPLKCPFTSQYDRQPWSQPMLDLATVNSMIYTITREGFPVFAPLNEKLRGIPHSEIGIPGCTDKTKFGINKYGLESADHDNGLGEWHLAYGGSIDSYTHTIDPSAVTTLCYVSCQTAFGSEITFTMPCAGTGVEYSLGAGGQGLSVVDGTITTDKVVMYSNKVGNKEGLTLTSGAQRIDAVSLDNLLLGLDWNTNPASWGLSELRNGEVLNVDAQPPVPFPQRKKNLTLQKDSIDALRNPDIVKEIQQFVNFMMERRYIGPAVYIDTTGITNYPTQIQENGKYNNATQSGVTNIQQFFLGAQFPSGKTFTFANNKFSYTGIKASDNLGHWGWATANAARDWLTTNSEYIKTDIWWYVENGLPWDQYICAITGFPIPQNELQTQQSSGGQWLIDQQQLAVQAEDWMKRFFKDAINYGNSIVDDSINKATQKVVNTNFGDPRIQLGDVIWAEVPGYLSATNAFGHTTAPFQNGIYVTGITRTVDLQQGTYQASYSGCRYRGGGNFQSGYTQTATYFVDTSNAVS